MDAGASSDLASGAPLQRVVESNESRSILQSIRDATPLVELRFYCTTVPERFEGGGGPAALLTNVVMLLAGSV